MWTTFFRAHLSHLLACSKCSSIKRLQIFCKRTRLFYLKTRLRCLNCANVATCMLAHAVIQWKFYTLRPCLHYSNYSFFNWDFLWCLQRSFIYKYSFLWEKLILDNAFQTPLEVFSHQKVMTAFFLTCPPSV